MSKWLSWHFWHIRRFFSNRNKIKNDLDQMKIGGKVGWTPHENNVATEYKRFENDYGKIKRMNGYFWFLAILIAIGYGFWYAIGAPGRYTENRGVDCPPDSGFLDCLTIYIDRFANVPLLFLMVLILVFIVGVGIYELMRSGGGGASEADRKKNENWLKDVEEESCRPTPLWLFAVLILFLLVEAAAITLIASSFVADFTRTTETWVGIFVGVVCASALGWLVHRAGGDLYRNEKIKELDYKLNNLYEKGDKEEWGRLRKEFSKLELDKPKRKLIIASIVAVSLLVALAFMQRYSLNMAILEEQFNVVTQESLFEDDVPSDIATIQDENQQESATHAGNREQQGLIAALSVLSIIFILVNGLGCGIGRKHSFIDDKSELAYKYLDKYEKSEQDKKDLHAKANSWFSGYYEKLNKEATERAKKGTASSDDKEILKKILTDLSERKQYTMTASDKFSKQQEKT